jgi:hypothetical protein
MKVTLSAFASGLSALSFQLIDRSFDHRLIGKEGLNKSANLMAQMNEGLPKSAEFLSVSTFLYAHIYISIQIIKQKSRKK